MAASSLENKTDEEIQAEILTIKQKFYDRMDTQIEKDLILEERERLAEEKRKLDVQKEFLRQKISRVYEDGYKAEDLQLKSDPAAGPEEEYYDVFRNSARSSARTASRDQPDIVPQRRNKSVFSTLIGRGPTMLGSHWSRASECCLRQQSYAIKNQLVAS